MRGSRIEIGLILIAVGVVFLLSQAGIIQLDVGELFSTYWPVFLIYSGLHGIIWSFRRVHCWGGAHLWNIFLIIIGVVFLLRNLGVTDISIGHVMKFLIPLFIIFIGLRMLFRPHRFKHDSDYSYKYEYKYDSGSGQAEVTHSHTKSKEHHWHNAGAENRSGFIGDMHLGQDYWELKPMNVSHFIGDTIIDLTKAQIPAGETRLNISSFIGDVKVYVPNDMDVEISVSSSSFLGDMHVLNRHEKGLFRNMTWTSEEYMNAEKKIKFTINMFIGDIYVQRIG